MRLLKIHTPEHSPTVKKSKSLMESPEYMQFFKASRVLLMIKQIWGIQLNWNGFDVEKKKIPKCPSIVERVLYYIPLRSARMYFLRDFLRSGV